MEYKIAGVTFNNDEKDGGESRQAILSTLPQFITVNLMRTIYHNPQTNIDEPAIKCFDKKSGKCIGWIARTNIDALWNTSSMTGAITCYKNTFGCTLSESVPPTAKQYAVVKKQCQKNNIAMPAYDKRAYSALLTNIAR